MPRFMFDIEVVDSFADKHGTDLVDQEAAHALALEIALTHLRDIDRTAPKRDVRVIIKDDDGETVGTVTPE